MTPLRDTLLDAYGGFADRRFKDRSLDRAIKVDDRDATDVYPYFCSIFVSVPDRTGVALRLTLQHAPSSPEVVDLVEKLGGTVHPADFGPTVILTLKSSQGPAIKRLARAIRAIVGRGRSYDDPNLLWICPRTAASLEELARHLALYRAGRRPVEDPTTPGTISSRQRSAFVPPGSPDTPGPGPRNGATGGPLGGEA